MQRLALELAGMVGEGESHGILLRAAAYLKRVAGWTDVDPRLRLDCVCTLCWSKREEALEALPPELRERLNDDWAEADDTTPKNRLRIQSVFPNGVRRRKCGSGRRGAHSGAVPGWAE